MIRRVQRMAAFIGILAVLAVAPALMSRADGAAAQADCVPQKTVEWSGPVPNLDIPDVTGLSVIDAASRLAESKSKPDCSIMNEAPQIDPNAIVVISQKLRAKTVGEFIQIPVVGLWQGVALPDLTGQTLGAADGAVSRLGLVPRPSPADALADWTVAAQTPTARTLLHFGDEVQLVLQEPIRPVVVPNLVGHTEDEAKKLVEAAKLVYVAQVIKAGDRPGQVVSQRPRAGEQVNVGEPVTADVVRTPRVRTVLVPDVVRQNETKARTAIEAVKLVFDPRITKEGPGPGQVVWQSPTPGQRVPVGTAVTVNIERSAVPTVGPPPARTVVPDVLGQLETVARKAIETARLKFGSRIVRPGTGVGEVLDQRPVAGTEVDVGSIVTVDLTREPSPHLVPVPDLVGDGEDEARGAVERVQLVFDLLGGKNAPGRRRHVVRQVPPAGRQVPAGTTVTVELAADGTTGPPWMLLPLLIGVGLVGGTAMARLVRRRRPRPKHGPPQVRAIARPLTVTSNRLEESGPAHRIRIRAHVDPGRQYVREEDR